MLKQKLYWGSWTPASPPLLFPLLHVCCWLGVTTGSSSSMHLTVSSTVCKSGLINTSLSEHQIILSYWSLHQLLLDWSLGSVYVLPACWCLDPVASASPAAHLVLSHSAISLDHSVLSIPPVCCIPFLLWKHSALSMDTELPFNTKVWYIFSTVNKSFLRLSLSFCES